MSLSHKLTLFLSSPLFLCLYRLSTNAKGDCIPPSGCSVALAYYRVTPNDTVGDLALRFGTSSSTIQQYNNLLDIDSILAGQILYIPFPCGCTEDQLGHSVLYAVVSGDSVDNIARLKFKNLTRPEWVLAANNVDPFNLPVHTVLDIPLNCSCGNPDVSSQYGLFATYVAQLGDNASSLSATFGIQAQILRNYNNGLDLDRLTAFEDIIFAPVKDGDGNYPPFNISTIEQQASELNKSAIIGASVGGTGLLVILFAALLYWLSLKHKKATGYNKQQVTVDTYNSSSGEVPGTSQSSIFTDGASLTYSTDRPIEFTYKELAEMTDGFSSSNQIGAGGFGAVYLGETNKKKLAIKMMAMKETRQFLAELKVLARVHHTNLVQLVGFCTTDSLFLVYEFVENNTLKHHLDAFKRKETPLSWAARAQIALDAATGLEYIHEYATPSYVHLDIKPENILLDISLRAKVADFGLAKLSEAVGTLHPAGTRGYMAPEYATYGEISPKVDVYSFGIVLMQLISAKEVIQHMDRDKQSSIIKTLPSLFEELLNESKPQEKLQGLIDQTLEDHYPVDSMWKMIRLAMACTNTEPHQRPSMKTVVSSLKALSSDSDTQEWNSGSSLRPR